MTERKLMTVLAGDAIFPPPIWLMRQAGRYLPEYRKVREEAGSFLDLCYNPELASEVTLQPVRRFGFDAAILFSDILVVADALGRPLRFEEGAGPILEPLTEAQIGKLDDFDVHSRLAPVYETVRRARAKLSPEIALLGFCGAPWTVATYMITGRGTPDQAPARLFHFRKRAAFERLLRTLADVSAQYLIRQIEAGADAVQIFDSWAGVLDEEAFEACCVRPVRRMVEMVRKRFPSVPVIGFPRGAAARYFDYRAATGVTALGLDWTVRMSEARKLQRDGPVQGNLDPLRLLAGGAALERGVTAIIDALGDGPLIFNLGHGVGPDTPVANVAAMIELVRKASR